MSHGPSVAIVELLTQAERCRRLARACGDAEMTDKLIELAEAYRREAAARSELPQ